MSRLSVVFLVLGVFFVLLGIVLIVCRVISGSFDSPVFFDFITIADGLIIIFNAMMIGGLA